MSFAVQDMEEFLSTPSARRATKPSSKRSCISPISIHALCEEGDTGGAGRKPSKNISIHALCEEGDDEHNGTFEEAKEFLSTPSARRATLVGRLVYKADKRNFYPRPLRGGRLAVAGNSPSVAQFLSTPSARRATV